MLHMELRVKHFVISLEVFLAFNKKKLCIRLVPCSIQENIAHIRFIT